MLNDQIEKAYFERGEFWAFEGQEVWAFEGQHDWQIEDDYIIIYAPYQVSLYKKDGTVIEENVKLIKQEVFNERD